ncbi:DNA repair protein RAD50 [Trichuris trichiura]|uniref:DNA repair protein RAD50 n=1 Tax=Trichuris trichiura TaxID=36087 RepID=A0A077Z5M6_TRITR|nr:DNA repair protein RAD50 [Trichuris trichiura]
MAELVGMLIRGIRSFSSDDKAQVIRFQKPLTLIVGPNGSGKTTIIECLKYATIGAMPPGAKGGAFVRDPKVYAFISCPLEMVDFYFEIDGENIMCQLLGVPKAVLDYVIFCHQEESNWPLSEPKILKDKFDELFCAERYTKAVDEVRKIRNNMRSQISNFKCELKYLLVNKERADKLQNELEEVQDNLAKMKEAVEVTEKELEPLKRKINNLTISWEKINDIKGQVERAKLSLKIHEESVESISNTIEHQFPGSDQELQTELEMYATTLNASCLLVSTLENSISELDSRLAQHQDKHLDLLAEKRGIEAEIHFLQEKITDLHRMVERECRNFHIPDAEQAGDDELISKMPCLLQDEMSNFAAKKKKHEEMKYNVKQKIEENQTLLKRCTKDLSVLKQKTEEYEMERVRIERKMNENSSAVSKLAEIETKLENTAREIETLDYTALENNWKQENANLIESKEKCLLEIKSFTVQLNCALEREKEEAELKILESELIKKREEAQHRLALHDKTISRLFADVKLDSLKTKVEMFLAEKRNQLKESTSNMQSKELLYSNAVQELDLLEQRIGDANAELSACVQKLTAANVSSRCSYVSEIKNITSQLEMLQVEKGSVDGTYFLYKKYISHVQVTPRCPACDRRFDKPGEAKKFIEKVSSI